MTETLKNGTKVFVSETVRFGCDPLVLACFSAVKPNESVLDAGCGCGIISLYLRDAGHCGRCLALDIDKQAYNLAKMGADNCGLPFETMCGDIRDMRTDKKFDVMICNPPYFNSGGQAGGYRRGARHDGTLSLSELCLAAKRVVKAGGRLSLCTRPERLAELFFELKSADFEPKRLRFCRHSSGRAPWLALVDAKLGGGVGLTLEPELISQNGDGTISAEMADITGQGAC